MKKRNLAVVIGLSLIGLGSCKKTTTTLEQEKEKILIVSTISGGKRGYQDGEARSALYNKPAQIAIDASGNMYIADRLNHCIRKMTSAGIVSTFAGISGSSGFTNGPGTSAQFNTPYGITIDTEGNIYVSDANNNAIRKITVGGVVSTFAGGPQSGAEDGTGTNAKFNFPFGLVIDAANNLYVADQYNNSIRKVTPTGAVTTIASGYAYPWGVAVDKKGNVYFTLYAANCIRKISTNGTISVYAGNENDYNTAYQLQDGIASAALFCQPLGLATDTSDNVYVADSENQVIRKISPEGIVSSIGVPYPGPFDSNGRTPIRHADGEASGAKFYYPSNITVDKEGNLYVSQGEGDSNNFIRKISSVDKSGTNQSENVNWNKPIGWK